ncbi:DNA gyrase subunit A, partial [bacterium]
IIADEEMVVSITRDGYIKRTPVSIYQAQHRGGRGKTAMSTKVEDFVEKLFVASTHDTMLFFTSMGFAYALKVYEIPEASRISRGTAIVNLLQLRKKDSVASTITTREFPDDKSVFFATKNGYVKRTRLSAFSNTRKKGIIAIKLPDDDQLIDCNLIAGMEDIMLVTRKGISIRFPSKQVRIMGRNTRGLIGIRLKEDDSVISMTVITRPEGVILFASENGFGKRTKTEEFRVQKRSGKGIIAMKTTKKTGKVIGSMEVEEDDEIVLVNSDGVLIRIKVSDISIIGRATQGVKLIRLKDEQILTGIAKVIEKDEKN